MSCFIIYLSGVREQFKNEHFKISLHPVIEYSLELPYGRQARIWITTETACYRIMSVSANYVPFWKSFYDMVCFAGHVVNILLNYTGPVVLVKLVGKVSKLSGKSREEAFLLFREHRKFIYDLLKEQKLPARIRKEYNALQSNNVIWESSWAHHLEALESTTKIARTKEHVNILSFFRPATAQFENSSTQNVTISSSSTSNSSLKKSANLDETSSLLSISEDESATYVESLYDTEEIEIVSSFNISDRLKSSFTSAKLMEWKLPEFEHSHGSFFMCPLCDIKFKTDIKDSLCSFKIHLRAHSEDCGVATESEQTFQFSDFETRFSSFRNDLQKLIVGKISYNPIPLEFKKSFFTSSCTVYDIPFTKYSIFQSEDTAVDNFAENPIKASKFNVSAAISSLEIPILPSVAKKPRAKKARVSKASSVDGTDNEKSSSQLSTSSTLGSSSSSGNSSVKRISLKFNSSPSSSPIISSESTTPNSHENESDISSLLNFSSPSPSKSLSAFDFPRNQSSPHQANISVSSHSIPIPKPIPLEISSIDENTYIIPVTSGSDTQLSYSSYGNNLGCKHYKTNCKIYADCCGKWFVCRFCHDDVSDHKLLKSSSNFCLCMLCGLSQKATSKCINPKCLALLALYYCDLCKYWDNEPNKRIFHCNKCSSCVPGNKNNFIHCDACSKCIPKPNFDDHVCIAPPVLAEQRPKLEQPPRIESDFKASMDQVSYMNYLKNSLGRLSWNKPSVSTSNSQPEHSDQNCWNCLNNLPTDKLGVLKSKFCPHCSAVIE